MVRIFRLEVPEGRDVSGNKSRKRIDPTMTDTDSDFVSVHTLSNRFEADLLMDALAQEGIPTLLRRFEETPYSGLFVTQKGWGRVMVPKQMEPQALEIIEALVEDLQKARPIFTDASEIDPVLWEKLGRADPEEIARNAMVQYDPHAGAYIVPFFNAAILVYPELRKLELTGSEPAFSQDFQLCLVILHYLLGSRDKPLSGKWVSEKDLPGGTLFFNKHHALPAETLIETFNPRPDLLHAGAQAVGGEKTNLGDISYQFRILPRIPLLIIFWLGDEEFQPAFHILFDETITLHLASLDLIFAMAQLFGRILVRAAAAVQEGEDDD